MIIDAGQTVFTVLFASRVTSPKKMYRPNECHLIPGGAGDLDFYRDVIRVGGEVV